METETFNSCTHVENALLKRKSAPVEPDVWVGEGTQTTNKEHARYYKMGCNRVSGYYNVFEFVQHFVIMLQY